MSDLDDLITAKVHDEVQRWRAIHDSEIKRQQKLTLATAIGTFLFLVITYLISIDKAVMFVVKGKSNEIETAYKEVFSSLLNNLDEKVQKASSTVDEAQQQAILAKDAATNAVASATSAADAAEKEVTTALEKFIEQADTQKFDDVIKVVVNEAVGECPEKMVRSGSICIDSEYRFPKQTSWFDVGEGCYEAGFRMCSVSEISIAVRTGKIESYIFEIDSDEHNWAWADDAVLRRAEGPEVMDACHVQLSKGERTYELGEWNCQHSASRNDPNIGGLCCK